MSSQNEILTVAEVAAELRCSKALVYKLVNGEVRGVTALPVIRLGRRRLVRKASLDQWKRMNENCDVSGMMPTSPEVDAVERMKEAFHA
jgi:excisionase family DNA binding protein